MKYLLPLILFIFSVSEASFAQLSEELYQDFEYRNVGPTRGGRVTTVTGVPTKPNVFFMGATGGGVWKTEDYGNSWKNISDGFFATASIGSIAVSNSNTDVVYVGTGSDGIRSNIITGKGMYKSTDFGKTWEHVGLKDAGQIGSVIIHPENEEVAYAAVIGNPFRPGSERGVFKTTDGGGTWDKILNVSDSTGFVDLEFSPDNPDIIYASAWKVVRKPWTIISGGNEGGIYKSIDGGGNWKKLDNGLPMGIVGKSDLAVSKSNPDRLWALVEAPDGVGGVFRSDDRGETFSLVSTKKELLDRPFYYCNIDANPLNADDIFVNSTRFWRSKDGGKEWKSYSTPHGDNHDIWIHPEDSMLWVQGNDGGANVTRDGGKNWSSILNQSTAELYQVNADDQYPYWLYAGQQDNSTIAVPSYPPHGSPAGNNAYWRAIGGCETGPAVPKPGNPNIVYSNCKGRFGVYNKTTGQEKQYYVGAAYMYGKNPKDLKLRFQRVSPIHVSPHDSDVIYHTSQYVHKSTDDGKTWETISPDLTAFTPETQVVSGSPITRDITGEEYYSTIYAIMESPVQKGVIWTGSNDGPFYVSVDNGKNWENVTPSDLPEGGRVQAIDASPHNAGTAYYAVYRYLLGDYAPYIYKTEDFGKTWKRLTDGSNGIALDNPTRVVREDPEIQGMLYAGTEDGMFVSFDDGNNWQPFQQNLPVTPITDIKVHQNDLIVSTMGRGFWIMENLNGVRNLNSTSNESIVYKPKEAIRQWYRGSKSIPEYPSPGVYIDYYLPDDVSDLKMQIVDESGNLVREFTQGSKQDESKEEPSMATGFYSRGNTPALKTDKGVHRVRWDMRHVGAWHKEAKRDGRNGPVVKTGTYTIKLLSGGESVEQNLMVSLDERVINDGVSENDVAKQEALALQVRDLLTSSRKVANEIEQKRAEAEKSKSNRAKKEAESLSEVYNELVTTEGRYMPPMLIDQVNYLYNMLNRADQVPGRDAYERYEELNSWFNKAVKEEYVKLVKDSEVLD